MLKAWLNMWKNIFNYNAAVSQKEYWLANIMNTIAMYVISVPCAVIMSTLPISAEGFAVFMIGVFLIPSVSLYFRRANDANWKKPTALLMAIGCPVLSGIIVGFFRSFTKEASWTREQSVMGKLLALSYGLFFYGGVLGMVFYGDPAAMPLLCGAGLILGTATIAFFGVKMKIAEWRKQAKEQ